MADGFQTPRGNGMIMGSPDDYDWHERTRMMEVLEAFGQPAGALTYRDSSTYDISPEHVKEVDGQFHIEQALHDAMNAFDQGRPAFIQTERGRDEPDRLSDYEQMLMMGQEFAPSGSPRR